MQSTIKYAVYFYIKCTFTSKFIKIKFDGVSQISKWHQFKLAEKLSHVKSNLNFKGKYLSD